MKKRGISPLLAWVLIIGFAVALGTFITGWAIDFIKNFNLEAGTKEDIYCSDMRISIDRFCRDPSSGDLNYTITNKGLFTIPIMSVIKEDENNPLDTRIITLDSLKEIKPGETKNFIESVDYVRVFQFGIVPWVVVEEEKIPCSSRKIILNYNNTCLNVNCSVGECVI